MKFTNMRLSNEIMHRHLFIRKKEMLFAQELFNALYHLLT